MGIGSKIAGLLGLRTEKRRQPQEDTITMAAKEAEATGENRVTNRLKAMLQNKWRRTARLYGNGRLAGTCEGAKSRQNWGRKSKRQAARNKAFNINWSSKALAGKPW